MSDRPPSRPPPKDKNDWESSFLQTIRNWLKTVSRGRNGESWREALEELIEEGEEAAPEIRPDERALLSNLLEFGDLRVEDVMLPRPDIVAVEAGASLDEILALVKEKGHSRMPVYRGTLDEVTGFVHIRDVLSHMISSDRPFDLATLVRAVLFVPPSMRVIDLLAKMRETRLHMAIVIDEYGGTDGLVTIEDLVEEIVGEIEDEYEATTPPALVESPDGSLEADARTDIDELEARLGLSLTLEDREEDIDTLGGLIFTLLGRVPARGELVSHPSGVEFEVLEADPRRIKRLRVRRVPPKSAQAS